MDGRVTQNAPRCKSRRIGPNGAEEIGGADLSRHAEK